METIVVGVNDSPTATQAAERAAALANAVGGRLVVATAYGSDEVEVVGVGTDRFVLSSADEAADFATAMAARLHAEHGVEATGRAVRGKPDAAILALAKEVEATLIVVGNVRMQGVGRLLGSVANDIAHRAPCDVYIVKTV